MSPAGLGYKLRIPIIDRLPRFIPEKEKYHLQGRVRSGCGLPAVSELSGVRDLMPIRCDRAAAAVCGSANKRYSNSTLDVLVRGSKPIVNGDESLPYPKRLPRRRIPYTAAMVLATTTEALAPRSNFSRFAVIQACVSHTFVDGKAVRELGYRPIVSREEAFRRTVAWLRRRGDVNREERSVVAALKRQGAVLHESYSFA